MVEGDSNKQIRQCIAHKVVRFIGEIGITEEMDVQLKRYSNPPPKDTDVPPGIRTDVKSKFSDENFDCFKFFYTIFKQILHQITIFYVQP